MSRSAEARRDLDGLRGLLGYALGASAERSEFRPAPGAIDRASDERFDWGEVTGDLMRIRSGDQQASGAFVSVRYRGAWYWIDDADLTSKSTFGLLATPFSLQAGDDRGMAPRLTLPVGR